MVQPTALGADCLGDRICRFCVWAPLVKKIEIHLVAPVDKFIPMESDELGYHRVSVDNIDQGSLYFYRLDRCKEYPDPASRCTPWG